MAFSHVNGQAIHYEDTGGAGLPVILGHGFLMDHEMFAPQVQALAPEFRIITWDARGFGLTEFDAEPFTYWDSARDCLAILDHLGIHQAVVGGSQGGFIALRAALLAPERVRALVLLNTQAGIEDPPTRDAYRALFDRWLTEGPVDDLAQTIASLMFNESDENVRWIAKWRQRPKELLEQPVRCLLGREDLTDQLGRITCPAVVIHGTADVALPLELAGPLAAGLSGCRGVVAIEGGSHAANLTHPNQVNPQLLAFLRDVAEAAAVAPREQATSPIFQ
ncbi:MAG TPA: alpha/beta hydrolase [Acidimicrobiia bacterium]|jgi:pimeloyl-ACP methyl ester carboxylesterase|nr:alpha/beta hydrolase [Acidimicrobiia bacterium]